jgi:hypothetical protein
MAHGIEPTLPFNLTQATFLVPDLTNPLSTNNLLAIRARQLEKHPVDLATIRNCILLSRFASARQFEKQHAHTLHNFNFTPGSLVLVRNASMNMDKTKPRDLGPMVVLCRTHNGAYRLGELNSAILKLRYAAFRLIPYHTRSHSFIPVTRVIDEDGLVSLGYDPDLAKERTTISYDKLTREGQNLNPPGGVRTECTLSFPLHRCLHSLDRQLTLLSLNPVAVLLFLDYLS